jgi:hypothetical protein
MGESHPDELDGLRRFLNALESGVLTIRRGAMDVTRQEMRALKHEIARLEKVLARASRGKRDA